MKDDHMKEAYDLLVTQLKAELATARRKADFESDRSSFRESAYAKYIYRALGKKAVLDACELVDFADKEYSGKDYGARDWADSEFLDDITIEGVRQRN